jgi:hypothetical protein
MRGDDRLEAVRSAAAMADASHSSLPVLAIGQGIFRKIGRQPRNAELGALLPGGHTHTVHAHELVVFAHSDPVQHKSSSNASSALATHAGRAFLRTARLLARFHQGARFNGDNGDTASFNRPGENGMPVCPVPKQKALTPRPCFNLSQVRRPLVCVLSSSLRFPRVHGLPLQLQPQPRARLLEASTCSAIAPSSAPLPMTRRGPRGCPLLPVSAPAIP